MSELKTPFKFDNDTKYILEKGTMTLLVTLGAGLLFGSDNMMIAFVLVLGANALSVQNLRIKTFQKAQRLIAIDICLVVLAYVATLNPWVAIPINLLTLWSVIYLNVSPYNQMAYKTFMMLFVFSQYIRISPDGLMSRLLMVLLVVTIVVISCYVDQNHYKALLPPQINKAFYYLHEQLDGMMDGEFDEALGQKVRGQMSELAYVIYGTSYKNYFTTYVGKVNFHFYLNLSYFNVLLEQIQAQIVRGNFDVKELIPIKHLFDEIEAYFERRKPKEVLMTHLRAYLEQGKGYNELSEELYEMVYALHKNFQELESFSYNEKNQPYNDWGRSELSQIRTKIQGKLTPKSMSFNFAARMAIILTILLYGATRIDAYKFIWAIIPVMSISQPYYEDTKMRGKARVKSNILASIILVLVVDIVPIKGAAFVVLVIAFYLYHAYKDYYHASIFLTFISMCIASFNKAVHTLFMYRILYVLLGAGIVWLTSKIVPYKLEDGIKELSGEIEGLNDILEEESLRSLEGKADFNRIREAIIYSAVLTQKLTQRNNQYQDEALSKRIQTNGEFIIRLGQSVLRNK